MRTQNHPCHSHLALSTPIAYTRPMDTATTPDLPERELSPREVDELLAEMAQAGGALQTTKPNIRKTLKVSYSHDAMIDHMLMNPTVTLDELAAMFGRTRGWISTIKHADAFKARMEYRRQLLVDPTIKDAIDERLMGSAEKAEALLHRSLEVLQEKLSGPASAIPDNLALRAAEFGAKAIGLGGNAPPAAPVASTNRLEELADRLIALQSRAVRGADVSDATILREG